MSGMTGFILLIVRVVVILWVVAWCVTVVP